MSLGTEAPEHVLIKGTALWDGQIRAETVICQLLILPVPASQYCFLQTLKVNNHSFSVLKVGMESASGQMLNSNLNLLLNHNFLQVHGYEVSYPALLTVQVWRQGLMGYKFKAAPIMKP
jgi:hypothetical protein